jgi:hypothetical protein
MNTKYIYIDSRNRLTGTYGNSYSVWLSDQIRLVKSVDLVSARIPNTMYNIPNGSNVFQINSVPINISPGFYSATSLVTDLKAQTNLVSSNINVTYLTSEGKLAFSNLQSFTFSTQYGNVFGFPSNVNITSSLSTSANGYFTNTLKDLFVVKSSNIIDLSTTDYVFLDIEQFRDSSFVDSSSVNGSGGRIRRTFGPIPLDVVSGGIKTFTENNDYKFSIDFDTPLASIERLNITWRNYNGDVLNFNGYEDNSVLLRIKCI